MPTRQTLRIATRKSALALWQAEFVKSELLQHHPKLQVELVPLSSRGDEILNVPLTKVGGKGLFVKELEHALLNDQADIAVHSMKDVPMEFPPGLGLPVICEREDPRDAFVSNQFESFQQLAQGAVVGTSSLRRQSQLLAARPDLKIEFLRGNVNTRLAKLDAGEYDAIILAAAGLMRLEMEDRIREKLETDLCLPAGGQGAVGIECRTEDADIIELILPLQDQATTDRVNCERALVKHLQGGCQVPIAAYAELLSSADDGELFFKARVADTQGKNVIEKSGRAPRQQAENLGLDVAKKLLAAGADKILAELNIPLSNSSQ